MKHTQKLIALLCSILLILISACPTTDSDSDDESPVIKPQLSDTPVKTTSIKELIVTFENKVEFVEGITATEGITVQSGEAASLTTHQTTDAIIIPLDDKSPTMGTELKITVAENLIAGQVTVTINENVLKNESGTKNSEIVKSDTIINDIQEYNLSYNTTVITFGTATTFNPNTGSNPIPATAQVAFTIAATADTDTRPNSITMNEANIVVADTTPAGTYNLTVTATPANSNYRGTKTVDITITVSTIDISNYDLAYTTTSINKGTATTFNPNTGSNPIPAAAQIVYAIAATAADTDTHPNSITMNEANIVVADTTPEGTYNLTVTATPTNSNYSGTKTANITITIVIPVIDIATFTLEYDVSAKATTANVESYPIQKTTIPTDAAVTYTIDGERKATAITIDSNGTIIVGNGFISARTYDLTVTATPNNAAKYTGTKTVDLTIVVE